MTYPSTGSVPFYYDIHSNQIYGNFLTDDKNHAMSSFFWYHRKESTQKDLGRPGLHTNAFKEFEPFFWNSSYSLTK